MNWTRETNDYIKETPKKKLIGVGFALGFVVASILWWIL